MAHQITARCQQCSTIFPITEVEQICTPALCPACRKAVHGGVSMTPDQVPHGVSNKRRAPRQKGNK